MNWLTLLPVLTCLFVFSINCALWRSYYWQKTFHIVGSFLLLFATIFVFYVTYHQEMLVLQVGGYRAPFGVSFVVDLLGALMLLLTGITSICVSMYSFSDITHKMQRSGFYLAYWVLLMGICGAFSTGDLFNLYVWFEIILIASFILLVLDNKKAQIDGTMKYVSVNLVATMLMLMAIAMLYGITGTLNLADMAQRIHAHSSSGILVAVVLLLTLAFSIKAALFPLFFWLPASYHTANVATAAICAGMLTKVGVYALIRLMTLILPGNHYILTFLLVSSALTMLTGVLGAASQFQFRRLLSFHIVSQIGYMIMGLAVYTPLAIAGSIYFMMHNVIVKTNLFLISGVCTRTGRANDIRRLGGLYLKFPILSFLFFVSAFSMAGIPPLSGFWGKMILLQSTLETSHYIVASVSIIVGFFTLYSMVKIWNQVFWKAEPVAEEARLSLGRRQALFWYAPIIVLVIISLSMGFFPGPYFTLASRISTQLLNPEIYISAVMGGVQ